MANCWPNYKTIFISSLLQERKIENTCFEDSIELVSTLRN